MAEDPNLLVVEDEHGVGEWGGGFLDCWIIVRESHSWISWTHIPWKLRGSGLGAKRVRDSGFAISCWHWQTPANPVHFFEVKTLGLKPGFGLTSLKLPSPAVAR